MGSKSTVLTTYAPAGGIAAGATIQFPYPSGKSYADFIPGGEALAVRAQQNVLTNISVQYGHTAITVTLPLSMVAIPAGSLLSFQPGDYLDRSQFTVSSAFSLTEPYTFNVTPWTLARWRAAKAKVRNGTQNAKVLGLGDSTTRGIGGAAGTAAFLNGMLPKLATLLTAGGLQAGKETFLGSGNVTLASNDSRFALSGGAAQTAVNLTLGGAAFQLTNTGHTVSFTPVANCDTFDVYSIKTGGTGSFAINLDGGATLATVSGVIAGGGLVKTTVGGSLGAHTLNCVWGSGTCYVVGVVAYNSAVKEASLINGGASGALSSNFVSNTVGYDYFSGLSFYAQDLALLTCGINDWSNGVALATYLANMQTVITQLLSVGDVLICTPYPSQASTVVDLGTQKTFVDGLYSLAKVNNVGLIDLWARFGSYEAANANGLYFDSKHPNGSGYADAADLVARTLLSI